MATYKFGKARSPPTKAAAFKGFPPEECGLQPALNSKVLLGIPYQTKRAKEICEWVNTKILNQDGQRIFFFRGETEEWSNVSLPFHRRRAAPDRRPGLHHREDSRRAHCLPGGLQGHHHRRARQGAHARRGARSPTRIPLAPPALLP